MANESELVTIKLHKEKLNILIDSNALEEGEWLVVKVDVPDFDYSKSEQWKLAKEKANKAYKQLKEIEFNIRNK